jgi:hypothetical protein
VIFVQVDKENSASRESAFRALVLLGRPVAPAKRDPPVRPEFREKRESLEFEAHLVLREIRAIQVMPHV